MECLYGRKQEYKKRKTIRLIIRIFILCAVIALITWFLYALVSLLTSRMWPDRQLRQKDCVWVSDDGKITIENDGTDHFTGTMKTDEGEIQLIVGFRSRTYIYISYEKRSNVVASFSCRFRPILREKGTKFTATVDEVGEEYESYFEEGQKIVFHRVDK